MNTRNMQDLAFKALKKAVKKLRSKAAKENRPLPIWRDGKVVWEVPNG